MECESCSGEAQFEFETEDGDKIVVCSQKCQTAYLSRTWFASGSYSANVILQQAVDDRTVLVEDMHGRVWTVDIIASYIEPDNQKEKKRRLRRLNQIVGLDYNVPAHLITRGLRQDNVIVGELKIFFGGSFDPDTSIVHDAKEIWDLELMLEIYAMSRRLQDMTPEETVASQSTIGAKWIQSAVARHPGALRRVAMREGLLKDSHDKLSRSDLLALREKAHHMHGAAGTKLSREVNLAMELQKFRH